MLSHEELLERHRQRVARTAELKELGLNARTAGVLVRSGLNDDQIRHATNEELLRQIQQFGPKLLEDTRRIFPYEPSTGRQNITAGPEPRMGCLSIVVATGSYFAQLLRSR